MCFIMLNMLNKDLPDLANWMLQIRSPPRKHLYNYFNIHGITLHTDNTVTHKHINI